MVDASIVDFFPGLEAMEPETGRVSFLTAQIATVPAGTVIFRSGSTCENYLLVMDGSVRVQMVSENGREIVLYRVENGQTCVLTTSCLMTNNDYSAEGVTETEVSAVMVPSTAFHELMSCSDIFRSFVFASYGTRLSDLLVLIDEVAFRRIDVRLARFLVESADGRRHLQTTHQKLAVELGSAREVVSRQLKEFERHGWLRVSRGRIDIIAADALETLARNQGNTM